MLVVKQYLFRVYRGQFQCFQVGEHNLQQQLIIYFSKLVKRNEENGVLFAKYNKAQTPNGDEVQTQNNVVKTWEYPFFFFFKSFNLSDARMIIFFYQLKLLVFDQSRVLIQLVRVNRKQLILSNSQIRGPFRQNLFY